MYVCMYACMYACMHVCAYVRMYVCMYVCIHIYIYIYIYIHTHRIHLEELAHGDVVQAVGAVEDHALHGHRLGEVLGGLRLPGARRA